jgi:transposase InsO family protein
LGRWHVVRRVVEGGETFAQAAAGATVSKSTVWVWVKRWRAASAAERASLGCLAERSSRPRRSPRRVPVDEAAAICELRKRTGWSPRRIADEPAFTSRALDWFLQRGVAAERLMTDNAWNYVHNRSLHALLDARAIRHLHARPYTPRTNGKVERYQQTLQREWASALEYASSQARRDSLPHSVRHYNERRTHSALSNRPPIQRVRQVTGHNI